MIIAFTIGFTEAYNKALATDPDKCFKLGETKDYQGGWIWKTAKEATAFLYSPDFFDIDWSGGKSRDPKDFSVYRVVLLNGWDDVTPVPGKDGIFHLKVDSRFYK